MRLTVRLLSEVPEYWRRYIDRFINLRSRPSRKVYLRGWVGEDKRQKWIFGREPPYTEENQLMNSGMNGKRLFEKELVEPIKEWPIMLGDRVEVLVGRDKGKQGIVNNIVKERNWVFVEGLNLQYLESSVSNTVIAEEMPLDVTQEVALVDPVTEKCAQKVQWRYTEQGEKVRVVYPSEVILPPPSGSHIQADGVDTVSYIENLDKDTLERDIEEPTYQPKLKTFEQDIMDTMNIKKTKERGKTYWY